MEWQGTRRAGTNRDLIGSFSCFSPVLAGRGPQMAYVLANQRVAGETTWWVLIPLACNRQQRIDLHCTCYVKIKDSLSRRRKAEGRRRKAEGRRRKAESRRRKAGGGGQKAEGSRRKAEGGRRKAEGGRQEAVGGRLKAESGRRDGGRGRFTNVEDHRQRGHARRTCWHGAGGNHVGRGYRASWA